MVAVSVGGMVFQSTLSMRRATALILIDLLLAIFQSTLSMRRATSFATIHPITDIIFQSTLSMRRATGDVLAGVGAWGISIHALHEESDQANSDAIHDLDSFQSTLSMRRATHLPRRKPLLRPISIHALHEESDTSRDTSCRRQTHFNPRSP